ncbi:shikimate dehydrogenase [Streptomyces sp. NPDC058247]|uniref:shikimate dehydrogenase n=1 Tax=Streptomyces sp. NPDC058247 TaxID=3346401 RepID=UPI0036EE9BEA
MTTPRTRPSYTVGLIGSGIGASLSPALHEEEARHQGLALTYRLLDLDTLDAGIGDLPELLAWARKFGFRGLNVTHPCKQAVMASLDALSPHAKTIGAVNTVVFETDGRAVGHNTDWSGFALNLRRSLPDARRDRVVLVGAGGAGAAVAHALLTEGTGRLTLVDADLQRAVALADRLCAHFGADRATAAAPDAVPDLLANADGMAHASPCGMTSRPGTAVDPSALHPGLWVAEVVYMPLHTELLKHAEAAGCRTAHGGGMAVFQAADAFRLFTGMAPDATRMHEHLNQLVGSQDSRGSAGR